MKIILKFILLFCCSYSFGQGLSAYEDYRKNFVIFDKGSLKTVEYQPIQKFQVGGRAIPYIDNLGFFKIYHDGKVNDIAFGPNIEFTATDNLIGYYVNDQLWAYDNGEKKLLSIWVSNFKISDHTIAYLDNNNNSFSMYQNGKITKLEDVLTDINELEYVVGENTIAYIYQSIFTVNYAGERFELSFNNEPLSYKAGRNIVAYLDDNEQSFKAFYKGKIFTLEDFHPNWYAIGDNMILYKDQLDNLKVFYLGQVKSLSNNEVTNVSIQDNICSYIDQGQFKVFFNGEIKILEYVEPTFTVLENNSVVYLDQTNSLKYFNGVEGSVITSERIANFDVVLNTITYQNLSGRNRVFYKGKIY